MPKVMDASILEPSPRANSLPKRLEVGQPASFVPSRKDPRVGVQACISVWKQFNYLFSSGGSVGGQLHLSDTGAIADVLLLPYWFWGATISAAIVVLLWWSFNVAFRR